MHIREKTLDDILETVFRRIKRSKTTTSPSAGHAKEINGVLIELLNPLARLSRSENRSVLWSCLGETLWYFSNTGRIDQIEYYIRSYRTKARIHSSYSHAPGAYGPRLFGSVSGINQIARIIQDLSCGRKHDSRQAVVQIYDKSDIGRPDVPCTCTIQFLARGNDLHVVTYMRSNDAYIGLPHDVFAFTWLQEVVARSINHEVGVYKHMVGSLHIYDKDMPFVENFLDEGIQDPLTMPTMPLGDPWQSIEWLLRNERHIRGGGRDILPTDGIDDYWTDLARLLLIYAFLKERDGRRIVFEKRKMVSTVYETFLRKRYAIASGATDEPVLPGLENGD
jgi:thymidylate synthase